MADLIRDRMRSFALLLKESKDVVIGGHERADGDVIGTMTAIYHYLKAAGKNVIPFLFEPVPQRYDFLNFQKHSQIYDSTDESHAAAVRQAEVIILLDASSHDRLPGWNELLESRQGAAVRFDHHPSTVPMSVDIDITDTGASATGQLVYDYFKLEGVSLDRKTALGLFTAIATDTGWFRYSNTTSHCFGMVSDLLTTGIDLTDIYRSIYQRNDLGLIRLMGQVSASIKSEMNGRFLWGSIGLDMIRESGLEKDFETDMLLDLLRSSINTLCVALFREAGNGEVRVNLRSKGDVAVNGIAEKFGGGGHRNAAGATIRNTTLQKSTEKVVQVVRQLLAEGVG